MELFIKNLLVIREFDAAFVGTQRPSVIKCVH